MYIGKDQSMTQNLAGLHRSRLETLLAVEIEFQRKLVALSNLRIQSVKKLLADIDVLHLDTEEVTLLSTSNNPTPTIEPVNTQEKSRKKKAKAKVKVKAPPPTKPVKLASGKAPRLIDALQMVIRNKQMGAKEAYKLLKDRKWLPKSNDPLSYIRFTLSNESEIFHRVEGERGVYHLDPDNPYSKLQKTQKRSTPEEVDEDDSDQPDSSLSQKAITDPPPPANDSEPPTMTDAESQSLVEDMINGSIPLD
jgi:hypothetical protein